MEYMDARIRQWLVTYYGPRGVQETRSGGLQDCVCVGECVIGGLEDVRGIMVGWLLVDVEWKE